MNPIRAAFLVVWLLTTLPGAALAQPTDVTLQGVLRSAGGDVVNGSYKMVFNLYSSPQADNPVVSQTVDQVPVANGLYTVQLDFDGQEPAKDHPELWLGIEVEDQEEYPLIKLTSVLYSVRAKYADTAGGLDCTGCLTEEMLGFTPLTEEDITDGDLVVNGTVSAAMFIGDGSGLTGISSPQGECAPGWFVAGIDGDGGLTCVEGSMDTVVDSVDGLAGGTIAGDVEVAGGLTVNGAGVCTEDGNCGDTLAQLLCQEDELPLWNGDMWVCGSFADIYDPDALPADGLNEISNDLMFNQFVDTYTSPGAPVPIPDNNPTGVSDEIDLPDAGTAQELTVSINISNSDMSTVKVVLFDPQNTEYVLYDKNGPGDQFGATYPTPEEPVSGDLTSWIGLNPMGTWRLQVMDTGFKDNETDGQINTWSIQVKTLSSKKVQVKGDLVIDGNISAGGIVSAGGDGMSIDEEGNAGFTGSVKIGGDDDECVPDKVGTLRYDTEYGLETCDGAQWVAARARPVVWRGVCNSHNTSGGWQNYCLNQSTHNTAQKYFDVESNGYITFKIPGWYRTSFWCASHGSNNAHIRLLRNGSSYHYGHEKVHGHWSDNFADEVYTFQAGDTFHIEVHNPGSYAYHAGNVNNGAHSGFSIEYVGPIDP